jgi:pentatricopeptide repeat protein
VSFTLRLGEPALDLLHNVMVEMPASPHHARLTRAIVELCRDNPERLAPWLNNPRETVVRSVVQMLGTIGGPSIAGMLRPVCRHADPAVRQEVLNALRNIEPRLSRPLLTEMLTGADSRMFCALLHVLAQERDPATAHRVLAMMQDEGFDNRSSEERRAIYSALSAASGDEVLAELEAELHKGNWFSKSHEAHRQAVARCVARIGTPLAREILERGAQSKRAPIRKACEDALIKFGAS